MAGPSVLSATSPEDRAPASGPARDVPVSDADAERALHDLRAKWVDLVTMLGQDHASLPYLLEGGRPQRISGGVLTIGFRYKLYAEKVRDPRVADIVANAAGAAIGVSLRIATTVVSTEEFTALDVVVRPKTGDAVADDDAVAPSPAWGTVRAGLPDAAGRWRAVAVAGPIESLVEVAFQALLAAVGDVGEPATTEAARWISPAQPWR